MDVLGEPEDYLLHHKLSWITEDQLLPLNTVKIAPFDLGISEGEKSQSVVEISTTKSECELCGKKYMGRFRMLQHLKKKHDIENLKCAFCPQVFSDKEKLKAHREEHRRKKCHICGKMCLSNNVLQKHLRFHSNEKSFQCQKCDQRFQEKKSLNKHTQAAHLPGKMFYCRYCKKDFTTKEAYIADKVLHRQRTCAVCGKTFRGYNSLKKHEAVHSEQRPYKCGMCNQHFKTNVGLKEHMKRHTRGKEVACDICNKTFFDKGELRSHQITHRELKSFQCPICSAAFKRKSYLVSHQRVHSGSKPFQCSTCHVYFTHASALKTHQRVHSDDKPYICSV